MLVIGELIISFFFVFFWHLYCVHFAEGLGYAMVYFIDFHFMIFYYLTVVVIFVFWNAFFIVWDFYYKLSVDPDYTNIAELRYELLKFKPVSEAPELEFWWTVIPSLILFCIAMPSLTLLYVLEQLESQPVLTIKAIGHQWYWSYEYTDRLEGEIFKDYANKSVNFDSYMLNDSDLKVGDRRLLEVDRPAVLPVNTKIRVLVTAMDVIHSWAIPSLGVKMDAIPGRLNQFYMTIPYPGVYYGQCSELCGANHGFMPIVVYAVSPKTFLTWYLNNAA